MPSVFSKFNSAVGAIIEQELNSKLLYMHSRDPTLQTCVDWERACKKYMNNKDIAADMIVKHTLDSIKDVCFVD